MAGDAMNLSKEEVAKLVKAHFTTYATSDEVKNFIKANGIQSVSGIGDVIRLSGLIAIRNRKKVVGYRPPEEY